MVALNQEGLTYRFLKSLRIPRINTQPSHIPSRLNEVMRDLIARNDAVALEEFLGVLKPTVARQMANLPAEKTLTGTIPTPLGAAAGSSQDDAGAARVLIKYGARVNDNTSTLDSKHLPLHAAYTMHNFEIAKYLESVGADKNAKDQNDKTPSECSTYCTADYIRANRTANHSMRLL